MAELIGYVPNEDKTLVDDQTIDEIVSLLCQSKKPLIIVEGKTIIEHVINLFDKENDLREDRLVLAKKIPPIIQEKYTQVFEDKAGFLSNLSVLDALFNLGPNCAYYVKNANLPA